MSPQSDFSHGISYKLILPLFLNFDPKPRQFLLCKCKQYPENIENFC